MIRRLLYRLLDIHACEVCGSVFSRLESLSSDAAVCADCVERSLRIQRRESQIAYIRERQRLENIQ